MYIQHIFLLVISFRQALQQGLPNFFFTPKKSTFCSIWSPSRRTPALAFSSEGEDCNL